MREATLRLVGITGTPEVELWTLHVPAIEDLEAALPDLQGTAFVLAMDAGDLPDRQIPIGAILERGVDYLCAWGSDCGRVHDLFDEEIVGDGDFPYRRSVPTTWHETEALEEAIWYAVFCTAPYKDEERGAEVEIAKVLVVSVGVRQWHERAERFLSKLALGHDVLDELEQHESRGGERF